MVINKNIPPLMTTWFMDDPFTDFSKERNRATFLRRHRAMGNDNWTALKLFAVFYSLIKLVNNKSRKLLNPKQNRNNAEPYGLCARLICYLTNYLSHCPQQKEFRVVSYYFCSPAECWNQSNDSRLKMPSGSLAQLFEIHSTRWPNYLTLTKISSIWCNPGRC